MLIGVPLPLVLECGSGARDVARRPITVTSILPNFDKPAPIAVCANAVFSTSFVDTDGGIGDQIGLVHIANAELG
jgi:hypothetical protein